MNYISLAFFAFIILFLILYYAVPQKYRYIVIFVGSYIFYGYADIRLLLVLISITAVTYLGGLIMETKNSRLAFAICLIADISILLFFKYTDFAISNLNLVLHKIAPQLLPVRQLNLVLPAGLSFIVFQSCTYLTDVLRKRIKAERNLIRYAAFVAFFPTVLSGPIQKARNLLPQISCPRAFDGVQAKKGTLLFIWGLFEKIMVANRLLVVVDTVFSDYEKYGSAYYIVAAVAFSLYIYADFSAYSDMARGVAKIMGIDVGKNFNNPYLSLSTSEFWNRWHTSLNSWLLENIYIPLGGNRRGTLRKYCNIMIVFLVSGLWHGANYHFIAWGGVNGLLVIVGQMLTPFRKRICSRLHVDEDAEAVKNVRRVVVFVLITLTWVFFHNGVPESVYIIKHMIFFDPLSFFDSNLFSIAGTVAKTFVLAVVTKVFCTVQKKRQDEGQVYERYSRIPFLGQCFLAAAMLCICIFGACSLEESVNTQFLYFDF